MAKSAGGGGRRGRSAILAARVPPKMAPEQFNAFHADNIARQTVIQKRLDSQLQSSFNKGRGTIQTSGGNATRRAPIPRPTVAKKQAYLKKLEARMSQALARDNNARAMRISRAFRRATGVATKG